jgi:hypothetical protein
MMNIDRMPEERDQYGSDIMECMFRDSSGGAPAFKGRHDPFWFLGRLEEEVIPGDSRLIALPGTDGRPVIWGEGDGARTDFASRYASRDTVLACSVDGGKTCFVETHGAKPSARLWSSIPVPPIVAETVRRELHGGWPKDKDVKQGIPCRAIIGGKKQDAWCIPSPAKGSTAVWERISDNSLKDYKERKKKVVAGQVKGLWWPVPDSEIEYVVSKPVVETCKETEQIVVKGRPCLLSHVDGQWVVACGDMGEVGAGENRDEAIAAANKVIAARLAEEIGESKEVQIEVDHRQIMDAAKTMIIAFEARLRGIVRMTPQAIGKDIGLILGPNGVEKHLRNLAIEEWIAMKDVRDFASSASVKKLKTMDANEFAELEPAQKVALVGGLIIALATADKAMMDAHIPASETQAAKANNNLSLAIKSFIKVLNTFMTEVRTTGGADIHTTAEAAYASMMVGILVQEGLCPVTGKQIGISDGVMIARGGDVIVVHESALDTLGEPTAGTVVVRGSVVSEAMRREFGTDSTIEESHDVFGDAELGAELHQYHHSMGNPVYGIGSLFYAGKPASSDQVIAAAQSLSRSNDKEAKKLAGRLEDMVKKQAPKTMVEGEDIDQSVPSSSADESGGGTVSAKWIISDPFEAGENAWRIVYNRYERTWKAQWKQGLKWNDQDKYPGYSIEKSNHGLPVEVAKKGDMFWKKHKNSQEMHNKKREREMIDAGHIKENCENPHIMLAAVESIAASGIAADAKKTVMALKPKAESVIRRMGGGAATFGAIVEDIGGKLSVGKWDGTGCLPFVPMSDKSCTNTIAEFVDAVEALAEASAARDLAASRCGYLTPGIYQSPFAVMRIEATGEPRLVSVNPDGFDSQNPVECFAAIRPFATIISRAAEKAASDHRHASENCARLAENMGGAIGFGSFSIVAEGNGVIISARGGSDVTGFVEAFSRGDVDLPREQRDVVTTWAKARLLDAHLAEISRSLETTRNSAVESIGSALPQHCLAEIESGGRKIASIIREGEYVFLVDNLDSSQVHAPLGRTLSKGQREAVVNLAEIVSCMAPGMVHEAAATHAASVLPVFREKVRSAISEHGRLLVREDDGAFSVIKMDGDNFRTITLDATHVVDIHGIREAKKQEKPKIKVTDLPEDKRKAVEEFMPLYDKMKEVEKVFKELEEALAPHKSGVIDVLKEINSAIEMANGVVIDLRSQAGKILYKAVIDQALVRVNDETRRILEELQESTRGETVYWPSVSRPKSEAVVNEALRGFIARAREIAAAIAAKPATWLRALADKLRKRCDSLKDAVDDLVKAMRDAKAGSTVPEGLDALRREFPIGTKMIVGERSETCVVVGHRHGPRLSEVVLESIGPDGIVSRKNVPALELREAASECSFKKGDRVMYAAKFLKNTGQHTGDAPFAIGTVQSVGGPLHKGSKSSVVTVKWDDDDEPRNVLSCNLVLRDKRHLEEAAPATAPVKTPARPGIEPEQPVKPSRDPWKRQPNAPKVEPAKAEADDELETEGAGSGGKVFAVRNNGVITGLFKSKKKADAYRAAQERQNLYIDRMPGKVTVAKAPGNWERLAAVGGSALVSDFIDGAIQFIESGSYSGEQRFQPKAGLADQEGCERTGDDRFEPFGQHSRAPQADETDEVVDEGKLARGLGALALGAAMLTGVTGCKAPDAQSRDKSQVVQQAQAGSHPATDFILSQTGLILKDNSKFDKEVQGLEVGNLVSDGNNQMKFALLKIGKGGPGEKKAALARVKSAVQEMGASTGVASTIAGDVAVAVWSPNMGKAAGEMSRAMDQSKIAPSTSSGSSKTVKQGPTGYVGSADDL